MLVLVKLIPLIIPTGTEATHSPPSRVTTTGHSKKDRLDVTSPERAVDRYFDTGLAPSTSRTYGAGIRKCLIFCEELHTTPTQISELLICRFVSSIADSNITHNTIKVYIAAIRQLHIQCSPTMISRDHMPWLNQVVRVIKMRQVSKEIPNTRLLQSPVMSRTLH